MRVLVAGDGGYIGADFTSSRFVRLHHIKELMAAGILDEMLRRTADAERRTTEM